MHPPGLLAQLRNLGWIGDGFGPGIQVAQTARLEANSSLFASLEVTQCSAPQRHEQEEAPKPGRSEAEEDNRPGRCHAKSQKPERESLSLATRADIRDLCNRRLLPLLPSPFSRLPSPTPQPAPSQISSSHASKNWRCASHKQLRLS